MHRRFLTDFKILKPSSFIHVSAEFTGKLHFASVTARTVYPTPNINNAIDGDPATIYHSSYDSQPEWLLLTLDPPAAVSSITIINR